MDNTRLLHIPAPNHNTQLRLVCFSYAGGSSATYLPWVKHLHPESELVVCQLPGRGTRLLEQPYENTAALVADLVTAIQPLGDKPLIFFGHSLGSKIAYELGLAMQQQQIPLPVHMIVSASPAPFHVRTRAPIHALPEPDFIAELTRLNGTSQQVLNNAELMSLFLPALRADFKMVETYLNPSKKILATQLTLMGGILDELVPAAQLADWNKVFQKANPIRWFDGDHFFINHKTFDILKYLNDILATEIAKLNHMESTKPQESERKKLRFYS